MHQLLQWYSLSDRIPDETTILTFRRPLEKQDLGKQKFETVKIHLSARDMTMRQHAIVDATLIAATSSTITRPQPECDGGTRK